MKADDYHRVLASAGGRVEPIEETARRTLLRAWRRVFATKLHAATGRWKHGPFEWHVFSFGHADTLCGDEAVAAYQSECPEVVVVCPESDRLEAVRLHGGRLPTFRGDDVYVWPPDLAWTMAFTHEESLGLGPYFSRRPAPAEGAG